MKKITILLLGLLTLGLTSCEMDEKPYNGIIDTEALQSVSDFNRARVGLYSPLRGLNSGTRLYLQDIQADNFNAVAGFSNNYGLNYTWQTASSDATFESFYSNYQALIVRANFILDGYEKLEKKDLSADDLKAITTTVAEAHYMRAFCLFQLAQYFCGEYSEATAGAANSGVSYLLHYAPSSNPGTYPARATLKDTYAQIESDLAEAAKGITAKGAVSSTYLTVDCIPALEARIALAKHDYATAAAKAVALIGTGNYDLADRAALTEMWVQDGGTETIWQLPCPSVDELAAQTGLYFLPYTQTGNPDYLPSKDLIESYDAANDYRFAVYFKKARVTSTNGTSDVVYELNKYRDTSAVYTQFKTEASRFVSEPKVFRIAEFYLIAAEAYAQQNNLAEAAKYLNALEGKRIQGYTNQTFSSKIEAMNEIKMERRREMLCEGTRLFDLRRWGDGVTRRGAQNENLCYLPGGSYTTKLSRSANDRLMVWPIPKSEIDANPQIVQNPGY